MLRKFTIRSLVIVAAGMLPSTSWAFDETVYRTQVMLNQLGYPAGVEDGLWGRKTGNALKNFAAETGTDFSGKISEELLVELGSQLSASMASPKGLVGPIATVERTIPSTYFDPDPRVDKMHEGFRTHINADFDFPSLRLSHSDFEVQAFEGESKTNKDGYYLWTMIQQSRFGDLDGDGDNDLALGGWVARNNELARLHYLYFEDGFPMATESTDIGGTHQPWVYDFDSDDVDEVLSVGFLDSPVNPTETYYFKSGISSKQVIGEIIDSHNGIMVDFDGDGDMDVVGATYNTRKNNKQDTALYLNTDGDFSHHDLFFVDAQTGKEIKHRGIRVNGASVEVADFDKNGTLDFVFGDIFGDGNAVLFLTEEPNEFNKVRVKETKWLTKGYFSTREWKSKRYRWVKKQNHTVFLDAVDIDRDGDKDLIVETDLWADPKAGVLDIYINDGKANFTKETEARLFNFDLRSHGGFAITVQDVNGDQYPDIIYAGREPWTEDYFNKGIQPDFSKVSGENDLYINDGTGHFVETHQNIFSEFSVREDWTNSWFPVINPDNSITFVSLFRTGNDQKDYWQVAKLRPLSTGPNFTDPAELGVPGFNEFFVLRTNIGARNAVLCGAYQNALEWYKAEQPSIPINAEQAKAWGQTIEYGLDQTAELSCVTNPQQQASVSKPRRLQFSDALPMGTVPVSRDAPCSEVPRHCTDVEVCERATSPGIGGKMTWGYLERHQPFVKEAKGRGLQCQ